MKDLINDIKTENFKSVYLLYGEETYLKLQYMKKIGDALVNPEDKMNRAYFEGASVDENEVIDLAETLPFFAERRLIILKDTGWFKNAIEHFPDYIKHLPDYLVLVFVEDEVDKRSRMYKAVNTAGRVTVFERQGEAVLKRWIVKLLKDAGRKITGDDLGFFLQRVGDDMGTLYSETDKLIFYTMGKDTVDREDILNITGEQTENRVFDMIRAVTEHRRNEAFALYADLLALKEPPMRILFLIARQYQQMLMVRELRNMGKNVTEIASKSALPPFVVRRLMGITSGYKADELQKAVSLCVQTEEDVKNGRLPDRLSVELLLASFC